MEIRHQHSVASSSNEGLELQELRDRVAELEVENASLRQLNATIHRNVTLFNALMRRSREGALLLSTQMTFLRVAHSVLGYEDEELAGTSFLSLVHPDDAEMFSNTFKRVLEANVKTAVCEVRIRDKQGAWNWVEIEMTDMLDDEDVQAIVLNNRRCQHAAS